MTPNETFKKILETNKDLPEQTKDLIKDMIVQPLKNGEVVEYRLFDVSPVTNRFTEDGEPIPAVPAFFGLADQEGVKIPGIGKVVIGNVIDHEPVKNPVSGEMELKPKYGPPGFSGMSIFVRHDQFELYQYLERHNDNSSNPYRDRGRKATFHRVDKAKELRMSIKNDELMADAMFWVRSSTLEELRTAAYNLQEQFRGRVNMDLPVDGIRHDLYQLIKGGNALAVVSASSDKVGKKKIQLFTVEEYGYIKRDENKRTWYHMNGEEICQVDKNMSMLDGLYEFTKTKAGRDFYVETIVQTLKKVQSELGELETV